MPAPLHACFFAQISRAWKEALARLGEHGLPEMTMNPPTATLTAAERMRRHRDRRRQGLRCLIIELRETEIDVLVGKGLLSSEMRDDSHVVRQALYAHLDQTLCSNPWRE